MFKAHSNNILSTVFKLQQGTLNTPGLRFAIIASMLFQNILPEINITQACILIGINLAAVFIFLIVTKELPSIKITLTCLFFGVLLSAGSAAFSQSGYSGENILQRVGWPYPYMEVYKNPTVPGDITQGKVFDWKLNKLKFIVNALVIATFLAIPASILEHFWLVKNLAVLGLILWLIATLSTAATMGYNKYKEMKEKITSPTTIIQENLK